MELGPNLVDALARELPNAPRLLLSIGDLRTLLELQTRLPGLVALILDAAPRRLPQGDAPRRVLRADPMSLPLPEACLDALIAITTLSRYQEPAALLQAWTRHLRPGARLIIIEPLVRSATLRRLRRLLGGPRFARPPEDVTGLLLNAGFGEIGQNLTGARGPSLITSGRLREL